MAPRAGQAGKAFRDVLAFLRLPRGSGSEPTLGRENLVAVFTTSRKQVEVHVQGDHERTKRRKKGRKDKEEEEEQTKIECIRMNSKEYHSFAPPPHPLQPFVSWPWRASRTPGFAYSYSYRFDAVEIQKGTSLCTKTIFWECLVSQLRCPGDQNLLVCDHRATGASAGTGTRIRSELVHVKLLVVGTLTLF